MVWDGLYLVDVRLVMRAERLFFNTQFGTHFREGAGYEPKPPLLIGHTPQDLGVWWEVLTSVNAFRKINLLLSVTFRKSRLDILRIRRVRFVGL